MGLTGLELGVKGVHHPCPVPQCPWLNGNTNAKVITNSNTNVKQANMVASTCTVHACAKRCFQCSLRSSLLFDGPPARSYCNPHLTREEIGLVGAVPSSGSGRANCNTVTKIDFLVRLSSVHPKLQAN